MVTPATKVYFEELPEERQLELIEEFKSEHTESYYNPHPAPNSAINALRRLERYEVDEQYYRKRFLADADMEIALNQFDPDSPIDNQLLNKKYGKRMAGL